MHACAQAASALVPDWTGKLPDREIGPTPIVERNRVPHLASHTGLMQGLPAHPLADPGSRLSRIQHQDAMETRTEIVKNIAVLETGLVETSIYTRAILDKVRPAVSDNR